MGDVPPRILILGAASSYISQAVDLAEDSGYEVAALIDNLGIPLQIDRSDIPLHMLRAIPVHLRELPAVCCLGTPNYRRRMVAEAAEMGITRFATIVHPRAYAFRSARFGVGTILSQVTSVGAYCSLGDHVLVRGLSLLGHNSSVGDYATVGPGSVVGGFVTIGSGAYIGIGAKILPRVSIGANSVVAAGAVVTRDVAANTLVAGAPARVRRERIPGYEG